MQLLTVVSLEEEKNPLLSIIYLNYKQIYMYYNISSFFLVCHILK